MASILDIIAEVITISGRDDLEDNKNIILGWLNRYKLYLQRDKRICFSDFTIPINATMNERTTDLPADFLFPVAIRRPQLGAATITTDLFGNQFVVTKNVVLTRQIRKEEFLATFPINRSDGQAFTGAVNDYLLMGRKIVWGPIPVVTEQLYLDYYRLLPEYNLQSVVEDDFTTFFNDGLLTWCLFRVFTDWVYDEKKRAVHRADLTICESGIRKYQVSFEHPMESTLDLPDM